MLNLWVILGQSMDVPVHADGPSLPACLLQLTTKLVSCLWFFTMQGQGYLHIVQVIHWSQLRNSYRRPCSVWKPWKLWKLGDNARLEYNTLSADQKVYKAGLARSPEPLNPNLTLWPLWLQCKHELFLCILTVVAHSSQWLTPHVTAPKPALPPCIQSHSVTAAHSILPIHSKHSSNSSLWA